MGADALSDQGAAARWKVVHPLGTGTLIEVVPAGPYDRLQAENEELLAAQGRLIGWLDQSKADATKAWTEVEELRRLLANATDPQNEGDWDEAREMGWAHLSPETDEHEETT